MRDLFAEDLVDARFRFLGYCFGDDAGGDDLIKDLAALFLAEQLYGILEQLGCKLLDNVGGIGIVKQLLDGKIPEIHGNTPFRYCGALPRVYLYYTACPAKWQEVTSCSRQRAVGHVDHNSSYVLKAKTDRNSAVQGKT